MARLKQEQVMPSSGVGRKITKYGYEDSDASFYRKRYGHGISPRYFEFVPGL